MKYILLASLLSTLALAAPLAQQGQGQGQGQGNAAAAQGGAGATGASAQADAQNGAAQGGQNTRQGAGQNSQKGAGQGQASGQNVAAGSTGAVNSPQQGAAAAAGQTPSTADLATAVANWMADTSMVSNFMNTGAGIMNNVAFKQAATVAFNAEVDELTHKAIIDQAVGTDPNVIAANSTLATGGAFQDVVDKLQQMSVQGRAAVANIDLINQNRCTNVLPNIDAYMAATGQPGNAVRPTICDQTGIINGVQSQGATQPGQTPGTPQAAFDAASALAAGTGNGLVNGDAGAAQGQQAQGQQAQGQQAQGQAAQGQQAQGQQGGDAQGAQGQQAQGQAAQGQAAQGQATQGQAAQGQAAQGQQTGAAQGQQGQGQGQRGGTAAQGQQGQRGQKGAAQGQAAQAGATK